MPIYYTCEEKLALNESRGILVDEQDRWLLEEYTWHIGGQGYACTNVILEYGGEGLRRRKYTLLHHCIMGQPCNGWEEIDHINFNRIDNRRCNLRYVTKSQQNLNTSRATTETGYRNITIEPSGTFRVGIRRNRIYYNLGVFATLDEAVAERDEWLSQHKEW